MTNKIFTRETRDKIKIIPKDLDIDELIHKYYQCNEIEKDKEKKSAEISETYNLTIMLKFVDQLDEILNLNQPKKYLENEIKKSQEADNPQWAKYHGMLFFGLITAFLSGGLGFAALGSAFLASYAGYLIGGGVFFGFINFLLYLSQEGKALKQTFNIPSKSSSIKLLSIYDREFKITQKINQKFEYLEKSGILAAENLATFPKQKYIAFLEKINVDMQNKANRFTHEYKEPFFKKITRGVTLSSALVLGFSGTYFTLASVAALITGSAVLLTSPLGIGLIAASIIIGCSVTYYARRNGLFSTLNSKAELHNAAFKNATRYKESVPSTTNTELSNNSQQILNQSYLAVESRKANRRLPSLQSHTADENNEEIHSISMPQKEQTAVLSSSTAQLIDNMQTSQPVPPQSQSALNSNLNSNIIHLPHSAPTLALHGEGTRKKKSKSRKRANLQNQNIKFSVDSLVNSGINLHDIAEKLDTPLVRKNKNENVIPTHSQDKTSIVQDYRRYQQAGG